jgi:hypothetical protein
MRPANLITNVGLHPPRINTLFVSTSYPTDDADWKGRFISNLVAALSRRQDMGLMLWTPPGKHPSNSVNVATPNESAWLKALLNDGGIAHLLRSKGAWAACRVLRLLFHLRSVYTREKGADVTHINWIQNAIPLWGTRKPAVISVLGSDYGMIEYSGLLQLLRSVFRQRRCILAPNAGWMQPRLEQLFGATAEIRTIPYGVDEAWLSVVRSMANQKTLKWLAVFRVTAEKIGSLFEWGRDIFLPPHELHLIGPMQKEIHLPEWVHYHGPASPKELVERWFPMAAGMIALSRHSEGRPQVLLEAMAAGLPVIASGIAAHRDIIRHRVNGWIVDTPSDLKEAVSAISVTNFNTQIGSAAREWVLSNIGSWDDCAERYSQAYRDIMEKKQ